jgi:small basic protein (TIGR04137 family)
MSIHSSLRGVDTLKGERSVFTRLERIQALKKEGRFAEDRSVYGLPKVRTRFKAAGAKKAKAPAEAAAGAPGGAAAAAPAAGAKGAPAAAAGKGAAAPAKGAAPAGKDAAKAPAKKK